MDAAPKYMMGKRPEYPGVSIADNWQDWGYREEQHHCVLIAFFESWGVLNRLPALDDYKKLAKVLFEHYAAAQFPPDARSNAFVFWLSGPNRRRLYSDCASREVFDQRYLAQFGPAFQVGTWLKDYHRDPEKAVATLQREMQQRDQQDRENQRKVGRPKRETVDNENGDVNGLRPDGNSVEAALRRLRDAPEIM